MLSLEELTADVESGAIDTVVTAFTDMQGRLMGKREQGQFFLEESAGHGLEGCNYLLALDMEMDPQPGYAMASWERGYGDFHLLPDLATLRRVPWLEGTAFVLCDVQWEDGSPVVASPRQVLRGQVERARAAGYEPMFGTELEFYLLRETYAAAHAKHYRDLTPSVPYILDYHVLATTYDEPLMRQIRNGMQAAGIAVESSKGEAWPGQQEINFRSSLRRTSTRTSATRPVRGLRRRSRGRTTTGRAVSASSGTERVRASRRAFRAATSIHTSRSRR